MAYEEYKDSGCVLGKVLYQLSKIGVPVRIVSDVVFQHRCELYYNGQPFATYDWNKDDIPMFKFDKKHDFYNNLIQDGESLIQDKLNRLKGKFSK